MKSNNIYTQDLEAQISAATVLPGDYVDENEALTASLETTVLSYALEYARMGWPVFPLSGKIPFAGSHGHLDATTDETKIREWWTKDPYANIGARTGIEFNVVEVDPRHNGDKTMAALEEEHGKLPENAIKQTSGGGGLHYFFALPTDRVVKCSLGGVGEGIDVKGDGGYVVVEPSLHPRSKELYMFQNLDEGEFTQCPEWLLDLACPRKTEGAGLAVDKPTKPKPMTNANVVSIDISDNLIIEGERNGTLFRQAAKMRGTGMNANEILGALSAVNQERCSPPLNDGELQKIVQSICRYEPNEIKIANVLRRAQKAYISEIQASSSDDDAPKADEDWMGRLELTAEGKPFKNVSNVTRVLEYHRAGSPGINAHTNWSLCALYVADEYQKERCSRIITSWN